MVEMEPWESHMPRYESFMLRVWHSDRHDRLQWTARLEGLQGGRCLRFDSLEALLAYLRVALDPSARAGPDPPERRE